MQLDSNGTVLALYPPRNALAPEEAPGQDRRSGRSGLGRGALPPSPGGTGERRLRAGRAGAGGAVGSQPAAAVQEPPELHRASAASAASSTAGTPHRHR